MMSPRIRFFLSHLLISILVACCSVFIVFYLWYPAPLAKAVGMTHLFLMMLLIDIIIGPVLGLVIYKVGKKTLKMDLMTIILLQILAFSYGIYSIEQGRPAWLVYSGVNFDLVKKSDIDNSVITQADEQFQHPALFHPTYVSIKDNSIKKSKASIIPSIQGAGESTYRSPVYYDTIDKSVANFQSRALPLSLLEKYNDPVLVQSITAQYPEANGWLGLSAPAQDMVVLINKDKGEIIKIVDLRPWQ